MFPAAAPSGAQLCIIQAKSDWYWHMVEIIVRVVDAKLFGPMPAAASFNAEVAFSRPEQVLKQSEGGCKLWHSERMHSNNEIRNKTDKANWHCERSTLCNL